METESVKFYPNRGMMAILGIMTHKTRHKMRSC